MQINPINNSRTFEACYRVPFSREGYNTIINSLKPENSFGGICRYSKVGSRTKNISMFAYAFPYAHLYDEEFTSVLLNKNRITKEEADKFGIKIKKFGKTRVPREVVCDILNSRAEVLRNKGIDIESICAERYIYVTTEEDTNIADKFMQAKIENKFEEIFGDRKELEPLEYIEALSQVNRGPNLSAANPKRNFIQRIIDKRKAKKEAISFQNIKKSIQELKNQLIVGNLSGEEVERITNEIETLKSKLAKQPEPRYIRNIRLLVEQYKQEKERFNKIFFENRKIIPVGSVEELLEKL